MNMFIDETNGNHDDLVFYMLNWDNEGFEYDELSDEEYDELPTHSVCSPNDEPDYDWISDHYQCLCVDAYEEEDENTIKELTMEFLKELKKNNKDKVLVLK